MSIVGYIFNEKTQTYIPQYWANSSPSTVSTTLNLNGGVEGYANSINGLGQIVGAISYASIVTPVYWENSLPSTVPVSLNFNGGSSGYANGINNLGQIVGYNVIDSNTNQALYWENYLTTPIALNLNGATKGFAYGINDLGNIVGYISYPRYTPVYWESSSALPTLLDSTGGGGGGICIWH